MRSALTNQLVIIILSAMLKSNIKENILCGQHLKLQK